MKRLFGTDGIRGVAGQFPLDEPTVVRIGRALTESLLAATGGPPRVVIGRDTRESGPAIEAALERGIVEAGGRVDLGGVLTTPAIACVTRLAGYDAGLVVSASHNPYRDNGIKVFARTGEKLSDRMEVAIEQAVLDGPGASHDGAPAAGRATASMGRGSARADGPAAPAHSDLAERYLAWLLSAVAPDASLKGETVVLDCANGAASSLAPELFRRAGAIVVPIHDRPDGRNINENCGALHPQALAAEMKSRKASVGLAFDGDADRCLIVDSNGRLLDGDYVLFLAARDLKAAGRLRGNAVVGTVMSNLWLDRALREEGIRLLRAPVGDKYVLEEMQRGDYVLGGEQSGHVIFLEKATTGDGLLTGLLFLDLLHRRGIDLCRWAAGVRPCPQILVNVPVRARPPLDSHPRIGPAIRDEEVRLGDAGRLLVRYSGTEPRARIMVEGESLQVVEQVAARLKAIIQEEIGQES
ncbi:MAG TPA: phosphoglucosamine mutase [Candidatus Polarisedimenticolia bacterium]|nr:phosphoglucosamine mutase [Candidatus Polarisedimenticolia bacterium]